MAYIGNPPAERFTSFDYQDLTGGTGTSFTLTHPVGNAQEILVMVNNVVQEPGVAYTVSGTGLTMTGSIAAADDFYVVYRGKAIQTATHPSDRALTATDGTFTGDASVTGDLTVDTNTLVVDAANNRVGVGDASPDTTLHVNSGATNTVMRVESTDGTADISFLDGNTTTGDNSIRIGCATDDLRFTTNSTERMRVLSGGGLTFNGDTAAANALDDYDEGTWTPGLTFGGSAAGIGYVIANGAYTKIGRQVTCMFDLRLSNNGSGSGSALLTGLPFNAGNHLGNTALEGGGVFTLHQSQGTAHTFASIIPDDSSSTAQMYADLDTTINNTHIGNSSSMRGVFTYFTA